MMKQLTKGEIMSFCHNLFFRNVRKLSVQVPDLLPYCVYFVFCFPFLSRGIFHSAMTDDLDFKYLTWSHSSLFFLTRLRVILRAHLPHLMRTKTVMRVTMIPLVPARSPHQRRTTASLTWLFYQKYVPIDRYFHEMIVLKSFSFRFCSIRCHHKSYTNQKFLMLKDLSSLPDLMGT